MPRGVYDRSKDRPRNRRTKLHPVGAMLRDEASLPSAVRIGEPVRLTLEVPSSGAVVLITGNARSLGKLIISRTGLKYVAADAKLKPEKEINFGRLAKLHAVGF